MPNLNVAALKLEAVVTRWLQVQYEIDATYFKEELRGSNPLGSTTYPRESLI
jgi:hypothetical protein